MLSSKVWAKNHLLLQFIFTCCPNSVFMWNYPYMSLGNLLHTLMLPSLNEHSKHKPPSLNFLQNANKEGAVLISRGSARDWAQQY